jgi:hypothetical protein
MHEHHFDHWHSWLTYDVHASSGEAIDETMDVELELDSTNDEEEAIT